MSASARPAVPVSSSLPTNSSLLRQVPSYPGLFQAGGKVKNDKPTLSEITPRGTFGGIPVETLGGLVIPEEIIEDL